MKRSLNATAVKSAKARSAAYKLTDGGGLYLLVNVSGTKLWRYKFRLEGKERLYAIGSFPEIGLAEARDAHEKARVLVGQGASPVAARKLKQQADVQASQNTLEAVARRWILEKSPGWSTNYAKQVVTTLERDVFPTLGGHKLDAIAASDLRPVIQAVAARVKPPDGKKARAHGAVSVALLVQQWCSAVFRYGVVNGLASHDPTYALRGLLTRPKVKHHGHLTPADIPAFVARLKLFSGTTEVKIALELLMLTFVRTGELRNARWAEIDLASATWRIPAHRMKMKREHLVPLSTRAVQLLAELHQLHGKSPYLFPNQHAPNSVMSATTVNRALERMGYGGRLSGHGFRGTASTFLNEAGYPAHIVEKQLAHETRSIVEASYNHAQYLPERRKMMQFWCDSLVNVDGTVLSLKFAA